MRQDSWPLVTTGQTSLPAKRLATVLTLAVLTLAGLLTGAGSAWAQAPAAPEVLRAYEAAWNRHDLEAVLALFSPDARASVAGTGLPALDARRGWLRNALTLQWCPEGSVCRAVGRGYQRSGRDGENVTWELRIYSTAVPVALDPWEGTARAVVRGGRIVSLEIAPHDEWEARWQALQDTRSRGDVRRIAQELQRARAVQAGAQPGAAEAAAQATAEARLAGLAAPGAPDTQGRLTPSVFAIGGAGVLLCLVATLAATARRPQ